MFDQKLWVSEVLTRSLGRAGMYLSQWGRVDHMRKKWGNEAKKMGGSLTAQGTYVVVGGWPLVVGHPGRPIAGRRPLVNRQPTTNSWGLVGVGRPASNHWSPASGPRPKGGQRLVVARRPRSVPQTACDQPIYFFKLYPFFVLFFLRSLLVVRAWASGGEGVYNTPIFWSYTWKCTIFHSSWRLEISFFKIFFFLNLEYTWTFISIVGIFVSCRIGITKNSSRFSSVMETFFTLLQYKVHLSMFHSLSTSKIWHTST
jgi:hypothetical protein